MFLAQDDAAAAERLRRRLIDAIRRREVLPARYPFFNEPYLPANKKCSWKTGIWRRIKFATMSHSKTMWSIAAGTIAG